MQWHGAVWAVEGRQLKSLWAALRAGGLLGLLERAVVCRQQECCVQATRVLRALGNGLAVLPVGNLRLHLSSPLGSVHHALARKPRILAPICSVLSYLFYVSHQPLPHVT